MSFDFSLLAQIQRKVMPLRASESKHGPAEDTVDLVYSALDEEKPILVIELAQKINRSQSNTGWCLTILKARGMAYHLDELGPRGAKKWVRI